MTSERENVSRRCLNIASDGADVTCDGRLFQKLAPETGNVETFNLLTFISCSTLINAQNQADVQRQGQRGRERENDLVDVVVING